MQHTEEHCLPVSLGLERCCEVAHTRWRMKHQDVMSLLTRISLETQALIPPKVTLQLKLHCRWHKGVTILNRKVSGNCMGCRPRVSPE